MKYILKESIAIFLLIFNSFKYHKNEGILSIYFHNPSKKLFTKIIKWLLKNEYRFISTKELELILTNQIKTHKLACITFDDGWRQNLELIDTINSFKIPITIFVSTQPVIDGNFWFEYARLNKQYLHTGIKTIKHFKKLPNSVLTEKVLILKNHFSLKRACISKEELLELNKNELITIGSHTVTHPILKQCPKNTQEYELGHSKSLLSKWLEKEVEYLAYPNGDFENETISLAKGCGYKLGFTTIADNIQEKTTDPYLIPRYSINDNGGYYENISKIKGIWQKYFKKK